MKKAFLFSVFANAIQFSAFSQGCLPDSVKFYSQSEIDSFQVNYPGCTEIEGHLVINGYALITNLNGLDVLTSVGGNLVIEYCNIINLAGLNNLNSIQGGLTVYFNLVVHLEKNT